MHWKQDVNMDNKDKSLMFACSMPKSYEHFIDALYRKQTLSLGKVKSALGTKKLKISKKA